MRRFQQELKAILLAQSRERRGSGAENFHSALFEWDEVRLQRARPANGILDFLVAHQHVGERPRTGGSPDFAKVRFFFVEGLVILASGELNRVVLRVVGFDENFAGEIAASRAARHLREQLKRFFGGAKIGAAQREIGGDDANQRDALKVVALRDHLRADEDVCFARRECAEDFLVFLLGAHGVAIETRDARAFELLVQVLVDFSEPAPTKYMYSPSHLGQRFGGFAL